MPNVLVWFGFLRIYVDLAVFQPYLDLEAGDNQSLKIQVARPGIEPRSSCSASQELNHSATTAPPNVLQKSILFFFLTTFSLWHLLKHKLLLQVSLSFQDSHKFNSFQESLSLLVFNVTCNNISVIYEGQSISNENRLIFWKCDMEHSTHVVMCLI